MKINTLITADMIVESPKPSAQYRMSSFSGSQSIYQRFNVFPPHNLSSQITDRVDILHPQCYLSYFCHKQFTILPPSNTNFCPFSDSVSHVKSISPSLEMDTATVLQWRKYRSNSQTVARSCDSIRVLICRHFASRLSRRDLSVLLVTLVSCM